HTRSKRDWSSDVCSSDLSRISSLMEPMKARLEAVVLESNFFHRTPGISSRSNLSVETHCLPLVTPGRSAALARTDPAKVLIKVRSEERRVGKGDGYRWVQ